MSATVNMRKLKYTGGFKMKTKTRKINLIIVITLVISLSLSTFSFGASTTPSAINKVEVKAPIFYSNGNIDELMGKKAEFVFPLKNGPKYNKKYTPAEYLKVIKPYAGFSVFGSPKKISVGKKIMIKGRIRDVIYTTDPKTGMKLLDILFVMKGDNDMTYMICITMLQDYSDGFDKLFLSKAIVDKYTVKLVSNVKHTKDYPFDYKRYFFLKDKNYVPLSHVSPSIKNYGMSVEMEAYEIPEMRMGKDYKYYFYLPTAATRK